MTCPFKKDELHTTAADVTTVVMVLLRTVIECVAYRDQRKGQWGSMAILTNMVSLLRPMGPHHFSHNIQHFSPEGKL